MHHYVNQLIDLLLVLVPAWAVLAIIFVIYAYLWTSARHFLLHHNHVDLAPDCCRRASPIADRSYVVPL